MDLEEVGLLCLRLCLSVVGEGMSVELQQNPGRANRPNHIMRYRGALGWTNGCSITTTMNPGQRTEIT